MRLSDIDPLVKIADCPEHGLHGERDRCFVCDGVDRPLYVSVRWLLIWTGAGTVGMCVGLLVSELL